MAGSSHNIKAILVSSSREGPSRKKYTVASIQKVSEWERVMDSKQIYHPTLKFSPRTYIAVAFYIH